MRGLSVGIKIGATILPSLASSANAVGRTFDRMNRNLKVRAAETKIAFKEMSAAMAPLASMAVAGGLSVGLKGILAEGAEYTHQIQMMKQAGRTSKEMAAAIAAANRTITDVPTSALNENLKILQETTLAFGGIRHAMDNLTFNSKMGAMMKGIMGPDYDEANGFNQLVRALELRSGKMSPADYQRQAGGLFRAMEVSGGKVNPEAFLGFAQQAGLAMRGYNERFLTSVVPSLIQEFGGERAGTAATALFNQFMGKVAVGGKSITQEWVRLGLVPANGTGGNLSKQGWSPGSLKNNALAMANPLEYVEKVIFPALRAHGVDTNDKNAMMLQAQKMFGRETGKRLAATLFDPAQLARIHADQGLYDKASGPDKAYSQALYNDPRMAQMAMANSLKNLETNLGKSLFNPAVLQAIVTAAKAINMIASAFGRWPKLAIGATGIMGFGLLTATLHLFGVQLKWLWPLLGGFSNLFLRFTGGIIARVGVGLLNGLLRFVPTLIGAVAAVLGAPAWLVALGAIALVAAGVFVWHFRDAIGAKLQAAWGWIKATFTSLPWASIGMAIANALTGGLASALPAGIARLRGVLPTWAGGTPAPRVAGHRALGGSVMRGLTYLVGERGPELFHAPHNGRIIPHGRSRSLMAGNDNGGRTVGAPPLRKGSVVINGGITIHGANDPHSTRRILREELQRLAGGQAAMLSD